MRSEVLYHCQHSFILKYLVYTVFQDEIISPIPDTQCATWMIGGCRLLTWLAWVSTPAAMFPPPCYLGTQASPPCEGSIWSVKFTVLY
jgi:hypothetical protein